MILLLAALLLLEPSAVFRFRPFDEGLPRTGQWRHGFAVADMNGDGLPDLAFSCPRKQPGPPVIFLNRTGGRWERWAEARFPDLPFDYGAVAAADFDGNGANDLAVASHYRGVTVVLGDGQGTFVASNEGMTLPASPGISSKFSSRAVVAADWTRDGRPDVIALSDGPRPGVAGVHLGVSVFENLGGVAWKQLRASASDGVHGDALAAGEVDGDGVPDVVTASLLVNYKRLLRIGADPALEAREVVTSLPINVVQSVDLRDFDGDGRAEAVIAYTSATSPAEASIELVSFGIAASPPRRIWSEQTATAVAAGDIDGDGFSDVVAGTADGRLFTFRGDGRGFVTRDAEIAVPAWRNGCAPYALRLADLDGDRRDEIVAAFAGESRCSSGGGVEVWRSSSSFKRRAVR